jgi:ribosomal protein L22
MSLHLPKANLSRTCSSPFPLLSTYILTPIALPIHPHHQRRTLFEWIRRRKKAPSSSDNLPPPPFDPQSADFQKKKASLQRSNEPDPSSLRKGDISSSSIFDDPSERVDESGKPVTEAERAAQRTRRLQLDPYLSAPALNPNPGARRRWLQRQVASAVRNRGVVTKEVIRKRNERENLTRSEWLPTSIKKLMPLARQVQGQSVEDALVQLRFSKKAVAKDVMRILQAAREEAIAGRGMGLGVTVGEAQELKVANHAVPAERVEAVHAEANAGHTPSGALEGGASGREKLASDSGGELSLETTGEEPSTVTTSTPGSAPKSPFEIITILDKKGKRRTIADPSSIYIAQAWVGRGPYGKVPEFRARGRMNILRPPYTSE